MPTDLPPDYKPAPAPNPGEGGAVPNPGGLPRPPAGEDARDLGIKPHPGPDAGVPGPGGDGGDVVDPAPGWGGPGAPAPAGGPGPMPSFRRADL